MSWFGRWRRTRAVERQAIDDTLWQRVVARFSFLRALPASDRNALERTALLTPQAGQRRWRPADDARDAARHRGAGLAGVNLDLDLYDDWVQSSSIPTNLSPTMNT